MSSATEILKVGRPHEFTEEILSKIEHAAGLDCTYAEIALFAGIHVSTLKRWIDDIPELRSRIEELRESPALTARMTVVKHLDDPNLAFRYLERKKPKEFMPQAKMEMSVAALPPGTVNPELDAIREEYEARMRKALAAPEAPPPEPERPAVPEVKQDNEQPPTKAEPTQ